MEQSSAQKRLRLSKENSKKEIFLPEGKRVQCVLKSGRRIVGTLANVSDQQITVNNEVINIADLSEIGKKGKGSSTGIFVFAFLGGAAIGNAFKPPYDPCPSCTVAPGSDDGSKGKAFSAVVGVALAGLSLNMASRNSTRVIGSKWKLDVVE